jgi:hypothetical protein
MASSAYPLSWPVGGQRAKRREAGRFRVSFGVARDSLLTELNALGAKDVILSTNVPLRHDGIPYAGLREPDDPGVAVYFTLGKRSHAMTCDRWKTVAANLQALCLTVGAMRGIARWGSMEMRDQAFAGFQALPPSSTDWRSVFHVRPGESVTIDMVKSMYRARALTDHPDVGGTNDGMARLNEAMEAAEKELGASR